eukprot:TRINITY_DN7846_c0_g1_i4.p1 TRINITY_DN7846_c0_g1~~TRINITY_DN7846_c0_g1_i4.p1  ORF type:complete len:414 (-),score=86.75 TRINITY_DN7846_c0_g1_i4:128-1369(-)
MDVSAFADVDPIVQDEGPHPFVQMTYDPSFVEVMNLFRSCIQRREISHRALMLTTKVVESNPSHSICWNYRRELLSALAQDKDIENEYKTVLAQTLDNPKCYQLWHQRRWLLEKMDDIPVEIDLENIGIVLQDDERNYQAWSFRQYLTEKAGLWDSELDYTAKSARESPYNSSIWNHRMFLYNHMGWTSELKTRELRFAVEILRLHPLAEAVWNYVEGVVGDQVGQYSVVSNLLQDPLFQNNKYCSILKITFREMLGDIESLKEAMELCLNLAQIDLARANYWSDYRYKKIAEKVGLLEEEAESAKTQSALVTHYGSCHCGAIQIEVLAPEELDVVECNCSVCTMKGFLHLIVPRSRFRLVSGEEKITTYTFNTKVAQHKFCSVCGISPFYIPRSNPDGFDVNVRCLDKKSIK